jgi:hypothetical protein
MFFGHQPGYIGLSYRRTECLPGGRLFGVRLPRPALSVPMFPEKPEVSELLPR